MRHIWTTLLIVAVAAVGIAALVDALTGRSRETRSVRKSATEQTPSTTAPLPVCKTGQLTLRLELLGGTNVVALRHVGGPPCQASDLRLRVYITADGQRSEIPFGQESVLDGGMSPGVERLVPFSICLAEPLLTAEAFAGPYTAKAEVRPGGENCRGAIREVAVNLGPGRATKQFRVVPLDPVTHTVSFLIDVPRRTDIRVTAQAGHGPFLEVLDRARRHDCRHIGGRDSCRVDYGLLGEAARDQWTVFVHKRTQGRAHISFAISFVPANG
jgi:hypothetical protein